MLYANTSWADVYWNSRPNRQDHLELCHRYSGTLLRARYNAKPDRVIHLNCGEVRTHASCKTTRTMGTFNQRGANMFLLSDKLLITNNSKTFVNGSKSIYPWKHQKTLNFLKFSGGIRFSDVFEGYRTATPGCNGLNSLDHVKYFFAIVLFWQKLPLLLH